MGNAAQGRSTSAQDAATERRRGFEELEIWKLARTLTNRTYELTRLFPEDERYGMTLQMRRAAVSTMSNIAEGWGRHSKASFANFLDQAQGSLSELLSQACIALDQGYWKEDLFASFRSEADTLGAKLYKFTSKLRPTVVREESAPYNTCTP